jgi:hypothetical protein
MENDEPSTPQNPSKRLNNVAQEIGKDVVAGKEEVSLDQPFPEEVKGPKTDNNSNVTKLVAGSAAAATADSATKPDKGSAPAKDNDTPKDQESSNDSKDSDKGTDSLTAIVAKTKRAKNKPVLLIVAIGIVICIVGIILLFLASFLTGIIAITIGGFVVIFGVLAPFGF